MFVITNYMSSFLYDTSTYCVAFLSLNILSQTHPTLFIFITLVTRILLGRSQHSGVNSGRHSEIWVLS